MTQDNVTASTMTITEFKAFIQTLWEHAPHTRIRVRQLGQLWQKNFSLILYITGSGAMILQEKDEMKHISIGNIMQFEIENQFQGVKPHNHYSVK